MIVDSLKSCRGSINAAARRLGITARMVRYKIKKLRIDHRQFVGKSGAMASPREKALGGLTAGRTARRLYF